MYKITTKRKVFREEYKVYTEVVEGKIERRIWVSRNNTIIPGRKMKSTRVKNEYIYKKGYTNELVPLTVYDKGGTQEILLTDYTGCVITHKVLSSYLEDTYNKSTKFICVDGTEVEYTR